MKKKVLTYGAVAVLSAITVGIVYAAFVDKVNVLGSTFSVSNADLRIMRDTTLGTNPANLVEEIPGPSFDHIGQTWHEDYGVKLANIGDAKLQVISRADYETANDPQDLRQDMYVEIFEWGDADQDGIPDEGEYETYGKTYGKKTIVKWKTEGIDLEEVNPNQGKYIVLRFSTENLSDTKKGATAIFDFVFEGIEIEN